MYFRNEYPDDIFDATKMALLSRHEMSQADRIEYRHDIYRKYIQR